MNGRTVGTFRIVCYIVGVHFSGVSVKRGSTVWGMMDEEQEWHERGMGCVRKLEECDGERGGWYVIERCMREELDNVKGGGGV